MMPRKITGLLKYWLLGVSVTMLFLFPQAFANANEASMCKGQLGGLIDLMYHFQYLLSWLWIVFGNLVGKLMTNGILYAEFLGMDTFLWKIWQMMRNFANFALGFFFFYSLLRYLLWPTDKAQSPINMIKNMLMTGVVVQMSRFIVMVVIDISTMLFVTVSAIPSQVIGSSQYLKNWLMASLKPVNVVVQDSDQPKDLLQYWRDWKIVKLHIWADRVLAGEGAHQINKMLTVEVVERAWAAPSSENIIDALMPSEKSLAGPLMYMGTSVFKTINFIEKNETVGVNCIDQNFKHLILYLLQRGMVMMYTLALGVLVVVLIGRVLYIRIFIGVSPIVFLFQYMKELKGKLDDYLFFNFSKMLKLIFQPVVFSFYISLMVLVLITLTALFQSGGERDMNGAFSVTITENSSNLEVGQLLSVSLNNTALGFDNIVLGVITLALMWMLVKVAITQETGIKVVDDLNKNIVKTVDKAIETTPLIPTPVGTVGFWTFMTMDGTSPYVKKQYDNFTRKITEIGEEQAGSVRDFLGIGNRNVSGLLESQEQSLVNATEQPETLAFKKYKQVLEEIRKERKIWFVDIAPSLYTLIAKSGGMSVVDTHLKAALNSLKTKSPEEIDVYFTASANLRVFKLLYKELFGKEPLHTLQQEKQAPNIYRLDSLSS